MRRCRYALLLLLALVPPAGAREPGRPDPKEAAEGWLSLFDGETTFGWTVPKDGAWKVTGGALLAEMADAGLVRHNTPFGDYALHMEYSVRDYTNGRFLVLRAGEEGKELSSLPLVGKPGQWETLDLVIHGGKIEMGEKKGGEVPAVPSQVGLIGRGLAVRRIAVRPLGTKSLFNGKDLTGWKLFPGRKSVFSVTPEGWLNVKDGPGDLQTEAGWSNFVLQLECISNGEHLNSGIFFRCRPGEYQQGYEAQVRNQFTDTPMQEYTLEDYDPKTHELVGKKKAKFTAVDFGTGAIYRRQPARLGVARDGAWFTMTVAAHGNHFATWVNGVQVTDWYDNRPPRDNARQGYYAAKGPISIQGHDPTTNLSFRNFRIADLGSGGK